VLLLFRRNDILGFGILAFVAFLLQLAYFVNPPSIGELGNFYSNSFGRFNWLRNFYLASPRIYIFVSTLFWLGFSIYFKQVLVNLHLASRRDFIPSIALLLVVSCLPIFLVMSVASWAAVTFFIALGMILGTSYNKTARSRYFTIGSLIGFGTVLYWPYAWVFLAVILILLSMRIFVIQELLALLLGFLFPLYLIWAVHYIATGNLFTGSSLALHYALPVAIQYKVATLVFIIFFILLTFYGTYVSRMGIIGNKLQHIKKWNGVLLFFFASVLVGLSGKIFPSNAFILPLLSFSIILCSALINNHKKYNTFTFYLVLVVVLSLQWVLRFI